MNRNEILRDPGGKPGLTAGSCSQSSISRSLLRAENLLRSTFNPTLKWLFHIRNQDGEEEEGNVVVAHNMVSRSSARLLHLQQALLAVAQDWQPVGRAQMGSLQVCVKGRPAEGSILLLPSSFSFLQRHYKALWRLLEQRSLLLFIHEYTRRAHLTAAYISTMSQLLNENPCNCSSFRVSLGSMCQELRVHLSHWSSLSSKVQSDHYLRVALVQQATLLLEIRQTLDLLGLQALVLMEQYIYDLLSAIAKTESDYVPREVLEDILAGTDLYNQAVEEQRTQHSATQLRTAILQQAYYSTLYSSPPNSRGYHPAAFSVKELMTILAVHHADLAAKQLHCWASEQSYHICKVHTHHVAHAFSNNPISQVSRLSCGTFTLRSKWTWEQLQHSYLISSPLHASTHYTSHKSPSVYIPDLHLNSTSLDSHHPALTKSTCVQQRLEFPQKDQTRSNFPNHGQTYIFQTSVDALNSNLKISTLEKQTSLENCKLLPPSTSLYHLSALPLCRFCQQDQSSVELIFQVLVSSNDLLAPLVSHTPPSEAPAEQLHKTTDVLPQHGKTDPMTSTAPITDPVMLHRLRTDLNKNQKVEGTQEWGELDTTTRPGAPPSSGFGKGGDPEKDEIVGAEGKAMEPDCVRRPRSVQWSDCSQSLVFADLFGQYRTLLWTLCSKALWLHLHVPSVANTAGSINFHDNHRRFQILHMISQASKTDLVPKECRLMLEDFCLCLLVSTAHIQWDYAWVMSKAYQSLSSWSLNNFLLITQRDLKVLRESVDTIVQQAKSLMMNSDNDHHSTLRNHNQLLLRQQLKALDKAASKLQTFSSLVLKTFSNDCKRMSGEIFEQTMPSAVHWRPNHSTGFPSSPSEYAALAAQTMIGQVLEGVAPLSDDARIQALSITMTAFMEAWMEHILKQKIKFSVQGALQLKQDFDSIRELIQSDKYSLPAAQQQQLLSLRVFQQVDSAVVCLLQQPHAKPYLQSRAWEPFKHCCPANSSINSIDAAVGSSITNLRSMEVEDMTQSDPSVMTCDLPPEDPSIPGETYLAPSLALGPAQQDWLDLRIHTSTRRWRLPGLQCLSKSEP
ncbi:hypothetical protein PAMP_022867 [Pampus punctatissimus]